MKDKLEELSHEIIKEIKDLKDLTKKELPEIAKEYITYRMTLNRILAIISGIISILSLIGLILTVFVLEKDSTAAYAVGFTILSLGIITFLCTLEEYLSFKMQPRRMAIQAITSLFNQGEQ